MRHTGFIMRHTGFRAGFAAAAFLLAAGTALAQDTGVTDTEIVLGASLAFTGAPGALAYAGLLGERVAIEEVNAAGGINGRTIRLIAEDDEYVPSNTVRIVNKLLEVDNIFALTEASSSSNWMAILPLLEEEGVPSINPLMASLEPIKAGPKTHFSIGLGYRDGAHDLMTTLIAKFPEVKWASIVREDETGVDHERGYVLAIEETGQTSVSSQRFQRGQTDFTVEVLNAREAGATGIFVGGLSTDVATMMAEAQKLGMDAKFATLWISHIDATIGLVGAGGSNLFLYDYVASLDDPSLAGFNALAQQYLSAEDVARLNRYAITGYANMKALIEAMNQCGAELTRACTIEKFEGLTDFETGVTAPVSFSPDNHLAATPGRALTIDPVAGRFIPLQ